jgi:sigma-B regulation protein RsbU (phosphoserine phosphatase)
MFLARLDPASRSLTYASAGHWPGYLFDRTGELKAQLPSTGVPLGLEPDTEFGTSLKMRLETGDLLLLLTDGIIEASSPHGELFGTGSVFNVVRESAGAPPDRMLASLFARVAAFDGGHVTDDRTAVLIEILHDRGQHA